MALMNRRAAHSHQSAPPRRQTHRAARLEGLGPTFASLPRRNRRMQIGNTHGRIAGRRERRGPGEARKKKEGREERERAGCAQTAIRRAPPIVRSRRSGRSLPNRHSGSVPDPCGHRPPQPARRFPAAFRRPLSAASALFSFASPWRNYASPRGPKPRTWRRYRPGPHSLRARGVRG